MVRLTSTEITINGKKIDNFSSFNLQQGIFEHHVFSLVCPAEAIDGEEGSVFNQSKNMIGATLQAQIQTTEGKSPLRFTGVITEVETSRFSGHAGDVVINGFSPTILLDSGPHCKSWEKKTVKNIAQDVFSHFPQNLLNPKINPGYNETLSYTVQYKETAWEFINRLCATYGEWVYYNGQQVILGQPGGTTTPLVYGSNLNQFNVALQVRPASFQVMAYDFINHQVYETSPQNIESRAGLDAIGRHVYGKSKTFYASTPKQWNNHFLTSKKQLDDFTNIRAACEGSNLVRFNGSSSHPGVQIGGVVSVKGKNVFALNDEAYGDYTVISVTHHTDSQGNYGNEFIAIPSGIKTPPVTSFSQPHAETQSALVTDNHDPKGLGRIRVRFHWMTPAQKTPWIRIASPHGGGGKGMFFIPEKEEEVIVGFEGDSPTKPYVIGTVYHGKANNSYSNSGNDVKALQTRSGNKIILNDAAGSIFVEDKDGNSVKIDGAGNITVKANKTITLEAGDSITLKTKLIEFIAEDDIKAESKRYTGGHSEKVDVFGRNEVLITSNNKIQVDAQNELSASATKVNIDGKQTTVNGTVETSVLGGMVKLNS